MKNRTIASIILFLGLISVAANQASKVTLIPYKYSENMGGPSENGRIRSANLTIVEKDGYKLAVLISEQGVAICHLPNN